MEYIGQSVVIGSLVYLAFRFVGNKQKQVVNLDDHLDMPMDPTLYRTDEERFATTIEKKDPAPIGTDFFSVHNAMLSRVKSEYLIAPKEQEHLSHIVERKRDDYNPVNTEV